jgi:hypothetical protein
MRRKKARPEWFPAGPRLVAASAYGSMVRFADFDVPPSAADMVAVFLVVSTIVVTVNVAVFAPAATTTVGGTPALLLLLVNVTVVATAATPVSLTVAVDESPPTTEVGLSVTDFTDGASTVRVAV